MADAVVVRTVADWPMEPWLDPAEAVARVRSMLAGADPGLVAPVAVRYVGTRAPGEPVDRGVPIDLQADGVLFMLNVEVFHPRGFALAIDRELVDDSTGETRERLVLLGDGRQRWTYAEDGGEGADNDAKWEAFRALLDRAGGGDDAGG